jgi:hypothetical protein
MVALLALALFVAVPATRSAGLSSASPTWNDAPSVHAVPSLKSLGLHRAEDGPRAQRRPHQQFDSPFAVDANLALHRSPALVAAAPVAVARPASVLCARWYDATAPPSCADPLAVI